MNTSQLQALLKQCLQSHMVGRPVAIPEPGLLVWTWFLDLCQTRTSNGYGPNPISFSEIVAYAHIHRWPLGPRHVAMILAMDRVWMEHARSAEPSAATGRRSGPAVEITPEAFDAVFS